MHFSAVAAIVALSATTASAWDHESVVHSTVYSTEVITVTACHPTVTNCPARETSMVHTFTVTSTSAASFPVYPNTTSSSAPAPTIPAVINNPVLPSSCPVSVKAVTTQVTSVFPTVIYETYSGNCPPPLPTNPPVQPVVPPYTPPANQTTPRPSYTAPPRPTGTGPVTAGASAAGASAMLLALGLFTAVFA